MGGSGGRIPEPLFVILYVKKGGITLTNSFYKISLDIHDHGSNVSLKAKRGDTGRLLYITLMDGRNPYAITTECRAVFTAKKADGNILFNECSRIGNTIVYAFTPQTTSAVGKADCEIKLYGADDKLLTSARFTLMVEDTVYNEGDVVEPRSEVTELTALISRTTELLREIEQKLENGGFDGDFSDITISFDKLTDEQKASLKGDPGAPGAPGAPGVAGKTAYEYAQEGGYTGTEAEFAAKLSGECAPPYTYSTEDLVAGTTPLETGRLHFVYE